MSTAQASVEATTRPTARGVVSQLAIVAAGGVLYLIVNWYTHDQVDQALANARQVLALERTLGIDWEHRVQDAAMSVPWWSTFCVQFYVWAYFPVLITIVVWTYLRHRPAYRFLRTALLSTMVVGFLAYAFFPCAPPWMLGQGYADPVHTGSLGDVAHPPVVANLMGAMPSMHVGWLLVATFVVFRTVRSPWVRAWCVLHPLMMAYVVVATGNHWVLDIPAGLVLAGVGLLVAFRASPSS